MYIVQVASECAPVAKTGGLADVVYGLSRELQNRIHWVEVVLPKYDCMRYDQIWGLEKIYNDLWVPWYGAAVHCSVWFGYVYGIRCFFIEPHSRDHFFSRGAYYGFQDDAMRFAFFCKAALEFLLKTNRRPDILHCHDWHTGLVPALLFDIYKFHGMRNSRVCYTIHNFKHQGICGASLLAATGLQRPEHYFHLDRMRDHFNPGALNLMKAGIVYANFVTTVSPQHAWEARFTDQGFGLAHTLKIHEHKFAGVLNGIDYGVWNPEVDRHIPARYGPNNLDGKYVNKEALRDRFWLRKDFKPIISVVSRLDPQKGIHLIRHALHFALAHGAQFVLFGNSHDAGITSALHSCRVDRVSDSVFLPREVEGDVLLSRNIVPRTATVSNGRLTREGTFATLQYLRRLSDLGIKFKSYTEQYVDSLGVFGEAIIGILAAVAQQERIRISERTKAGLGACPSIQP